MLTGEKAYDLKQYANAPALLQKDFELEKDPAKKQEIADIINIAAQRNGTKQL